MSNNDLLIDDEQQQQRCLSQASSSAAAGVSPGDYAPSPNTCSQALVRANQLRVQTLLRQLLVPTTELNHRLSTLRVLRRTMRELDHQLSWLTQVDFFETMERILRNETIDLNSDWRLIHDTTQLLIESLPRVGFEPDAQTLGQIFASSVQNLGHKRSEVRRAALLLINMELNERRQSTNFQRLLKIFIDYGLANERNKQAQKGAILSLPLLMTEQVVEGENLLPLIGCLSELLVDAEPQLFYSLYLALQRLHMTLGDQQFFAYLRQCRPDAIMLYKQATSRSGSMEQTSSNSRKRSLLKSNAESHPNQDFIQKEQPAANAAATQSSDSKQVTFEADSMVVDQKRLDSVNSQQTNYPDESSNIHQANESETINYGNDDEEEEEEDEHITSVDYAPGLSDSTSCATSDAEGSTSLASNKQKNQSNLALDRSTSVSSTCSSEANLVDPVHYMNAAALSGHPLANYDQVHHIDHSNVTGLAINDMCVSCSPTMELGPSVQNELKFGIFPKHLVQAALGNRYLDRLEALQEMMCIIRDSPINHLAILMTYFDSFLGQFLSKLMEQGTDYKVELIAIDMIETIVIKTKVSSMQYIRPMVGLLVKSLGDSRSIFRDNSVRVIHKMMAFLPPQHVIDAIFEHKHSKSPLVREESVNRVTGAVLDYDRNEFNLTKLCYHILPMLADHQASVRLAALECIATLAHALGPERIGSLLTAAEAVQTGCDYDGFLDAIYARIMRRSLPRCNADGSIRYVIKPFLNAAGTTYHQEHQAADVRWVLEAPSRHQHHHNQQDHHSGGEELHHSHRPGVYSPVLAGTAVTARRCSIPATLINEQSIEHQHHHHHHHHHHTNKHQRQQQQQQQQQSKGNSRNQSQEESPQQRDSHAAPNCNSVTDPAGQSAGTTQQNEEMRTMAPNSNSNLNKQQQPEISKRRESCKQMSSSDTQQQQQTTSEIGSNNKRRQSRLSGSQQTVSGSGSSSLEKTTAATSKDELTADKSQTSRSIVERESSGGRTKRSSSQDSCSSTDTNKVLFQYYLGKFKQSLEETNHSTGAMHSEAVLPSDSIIYTDVVQAYELSRHQSRYQQTSFDYERGSVGRIPVGVADCSGDGHDIRSESTTCSKGQRRRIDSAERSGDSSGSESPQTIMEQLNGTRRRSELKNNNSSSLGEKDDLGKGEQQQQKEDEKQRFGRKASRHSSREQEQDELSQQQTLNDESAVDWQQTKECRNKSRQLSDTQRQQQSGEGEGCSRKSSGGGQSQSGGSRQNTIVREESLSVGKCSSESNPKCDTGESASMLTRDSLEQNADARNRSSNLSSREAASELGIANERQNIEPQQSQQRPRVGLVRQSASAMVGDEPNDDIIIEKSSPTPVGGDDSDQLVKNENELIGESSSLNKQPAAPRRQESTGTTDSHSSQRECSDHATQTTPQHDSTTTQSRQSRRRRGSRRSSHRREPREEPTKGASPDEDDEDEQVRGSGGSGSGHQELRRRASRSQPPARQLSRTSSRSHLHHDKQTSGAGNMSGQDIRRSVSVSPSVATNVNIRHILENVAESEGAFQEPQLAFRVALEALSGPCWSTKVEGLLALIRLAAYHQQILLARLHEIVCRVANETKNLRSTVARSAIFTLGDFCARLERNIEPEMETIVQALLQKSTENTAFIRDDIRRAFTIMADHLTQWRLANALITHGSNHKNMHVRRMASQFVAYLVEKMGPAKCLVGARDISAKLIPAAAKFAQDSSPHTRYYGRLILARIMLHNSFERLMRKTLTPNLYRSTVGIVESIKRRGAGDPPADF